MFLIGEGVGSEVCSVMVACGAVFRTCVFFQGESGFCWCRDPPRERAGSGQGAGRERARSGQGAPLHEPSPPENDKIKRLKEQGMTAKEHATGAMEHGTKISDRI